MTSEGSAPPSLPRHVAIIMDGNGRWANLRGLPRVEGHRMGVRSVRAVVDCGRELGIRYLTLYAFSVENWGRPATEVRALIPSARSSSSGAFHIPPTPDPASAPSATTDLPPFAVRQAPGSHRRRHGGDYRDDLDIGALVRGAQRDRPRRAPPRRRAVGGKSARGGDRGRDVHHAPLHRGLPRPRPRHPHQRGVPRQQLPALAIRLHRVRDPGPLWPDFGKAEHLQALEEYSAPGAALRRRDRPPGPHADPGE